MISYTYMLIRSTYLPIKVDAPDIIYYYYYSSRANGEKIHRVFAIFSTRDEFD